ncbi:VWA domain-containing protein [candidate division KSB1 bacterium]|nr:VWA domain-containing protein [candidate division KSB1 bacterium]NIR71481.1 VWA domain-containing protein [candidate division KSB1 bacterium]NIS23402.1 VWA domain-containing protein [candidate division KSB1 bacterium]NIT70293.1 VWA domain-containing protein [candidate division KSB1 bacterium]NIU24016.1 VWA domain-containing protein [candidate division KSB1 bacterium]
MLRFANPEFLLLFLLIPIIVLWYLRRNRVRTGTIKYSNLGLVKNVDKYSNRKKYRHVTFVLRLIALSLLILCFARPQSGRTEEEVITEGVDIVIALDISSSMLAEDFKPNNRLQAAKLVAADFIRGRRNDRIGMVVFAAKSFTQCPLTLDYGILLNFVGEVEIGMIEDGTAIGMAIANAANRLRDSKAKSKVIILLTDGQNNRGQLDPITAAKVAKAFDIRMYTVGVGKRGEALYPVDDPIFGKRYIRRPVQIDEEMLKEIANITNGHYFRATDKENLDKIFERIDELEKTKIEVKQFTRYKELFTNYLLLALGVIVMEVVLTNTKFRKIP